MTRSNRTRHFEWMNCQTGEVFTEKARDSWGGFVNMVRRVEQRFGTDLRCHADDEGNATFTAEGLTLVVAEVQKL